MHRGHAFRDEDEGRPNDGPRFRCGSQRRILRAAGLMSLHPLQLSARPTERNIQQRCVFKQGPASREVSVDSVHVAARRRKRPKEASRAAPAALGRRGRPGPYHPRRALLRVPHLRASGGTIVFRPAFCHSVQPPSKPITVLNYYIKVSNPPSIAVRPASLTFTPLDSLVTSMAPVCTFLRGNRRGMALCMMASQC